MKKTIKKLLAALFLLTFFAVFFIAGSMEQDYITITQGLIASAINFTVMLYSGIKTGLLDIGGYDK